MLWAAATPCVVPVSWAVPISWVVATQRLAARSLGRRRFHGMWQCHGRRRCRGRRRFRWRGRSRVSAAMPWAVAMLWVGGDPMRRGRVKLWICWVVARLGASKQGRSRVGTGGSPSTWPEPAARGSDPGEHRCRRHDFARRIRIARSGARAELGPAGFGVEASSAPLRQTVPAAPIFVRMRAPTRPISAESTANTPRGCFGGPQEHSTGTSTSVSMHGSQAGRLSTRSEVDDPTQEQRSIVPKTAFRVAS